jgi:hypothetical protein
LTAARLSAFIFFNTRIDSAGCPVGRYADDFEKTANAGVARDADAPAISDGWIVFAGSVRYPAASDASVTEASEARAASHNVLTDREIGK